MNKKIIIIILGIIVTVVIGGVMFKNYSNDLQVKANLKEEMKQLSTKITKSETLISNNEGFHENFDKTRFQYEIDVAKEMLENPGCTSEEVYNGTLNLAQADKDYECTTLTEKPIEKPKETPIEVNITPTETKDKYTDEEKEEIRRYCEDRWNEYDKRVADGYSADKYDKEVFNDVSTRFGISESEAQSIWLAN